MNKQELIDKLASLVGSMEDFKGITAFHDGKYAGLEYALELIKQLDEPQKPVVDSFVAEWFEDNKDALDLAIFMAIRELDDEEWPHKTDFENWLDVAENKPIETLIHMKDGYEVEKEPLYEVIIGNLFLVKKFNNKNDSCFVNKFELCWWEKSAYQLTEPEIKAIDERYWPFAVPVEEVAEG
ncbi:hypothetical protein A5813_000063 [Enterococcus faecium]|uniref:DUF1642 domain-containing protein n=1 Tax=Enterococcus faecium TaxID=1352 RepID=UPI000A342464|nr:DUF1642 domain-containing protein [Enterococcus faecium]EMF0297007.1 DUF1642 domain-containing protein [Enterococcus hirae]OTO54642.1 hypothetical protein A5813_000063 [Enterococcus faecium]OTO62260.1 hypothetical protein A5812_001175 [Enterococcus faecium]